MGDRRESEISFGHGSVGGARTLPCLAVQRPNACELVLRVGDRPFDRWVQGERSLTRVIGRRYGRMAREGSIPDPRHRPGDATGVRSDPLAKMARYYRAHLAIAAINSDYVYLHIGHDLRRSSELC